jgi:multimeric flavodoxin WrbA
VAGEKVVVVLGSPRRDGNSTALAKRVIAGAKACGADVEAFHLHSMKIAPCRACDSCRNDPAKGCAIDDQMQTLYPKLRQADALVIASPVYWFTMSAQTKLFMDRCYALGGPDGHALKGKKVGILLTYADADPFSSGAVNALRTFQDSFNYIGADIVGMLYGSAWGAGEIQANKELMKQAYALGKQLGAGDRKSRR